MSAHTSNKKYFLSFFWMILFTIASFSLVKYQWFNFTQTFWLMTILAFIQVFLQLFTFMHLDQKGQGLIITFMVAGTIIALVSAVGIVLM